MENIDLDLYGITENVITFEQFKLKKKQLIKESNSIDSEQRPARMKKPAEAPGVSTNPKSFFPDIYIQDELCAMLIDKYGKERGEKTFDGLLNAKQTGAFFQQGGIIAAEKAGLIQALGLKSNGDYWQYSYYQMWKDWMTKIGQSINLNTKTITKSVAPIPAPIPDSKTIFQKINIAFADLTGKGITDVEKNKSKLRISNLLQDKNPISSARKMVNATNELYKLIQRAYYAQQLGNDDIAKMFWNKAVSLGAKNESANNEILINNDGKTVQEVANDFRYKYGIVVEDVVEEILNALYDEGIKEDMGTRPFWYAVQKALSNEDIKTNMQ